MIVSAVAFLKRTLTQREKAIDCVKSVSFVSLLHAPSPEFGLGEIRQKTINDVDHFLLK